jgi:hypothetical protein
VGVFVAHFEAVEYRVDSETAKDTDGDGER